MTTEKALRITQGFLFTIFRRGIASFIKERLFCILKAHFPKLTV